VLAVGALSLALRVGRLEVLVGAIGLLSVLFLAATLVGRFSGLLPWGIALGGGEYAAYLLLREGTMDGFAPVYAAGLLLVAELAYWSLDRLVRGLGEGLLFRRGSLVLAVCIAGGGIGGLILAAAGFSFTGGLGLEIFGVAAAVAALGLLARLARQS
jgi:hypothetical protein